ncbi:PTB/PI domain [Trinorchestia longiramus]|nr:PTB/PI domain [Trinorchestia longiramus]
MLFTLHSILPSCPRHNPAKLNTNGKSVQPGPAESSSVHDETSEKILNTDTPGDDDTAAGFIAADFSTILSPSFFNSGSSSYSSANSSFSSKHSPLVSSCIPHSASDSLESKASSNDVDPPMFSESQCSIPEEGIVAASPALVVPDVNAASTECSPDLSERTKVVDDFEACFVPVKKTSLCKENFSNNLDVGGSKKYEKSSALSSLGEFSSGSYYVNIVNEVSESGLTPLILENINEDNNESDDDENITSMVLFRSSPCLGANDKFCIKPPTSVKTKVEASASDLYDNVVDGLQSSSSFTNEPSAGELQLHNHLLHNSGTAADGETQHDNIQQQSNCSSINSNAGKPNETEQENFEKDNGLDHIYAVPSCPIPPPLFNFSAPTSPSSSPTLQHSFLTIMTNSDDASVPAAVIENLIDFPAVENTAPSLSENPFSTASLCPSPPVFSEASVFGSPYENVLIPSVVELPTKLEHSPSSSDGEKYGGRMPADRRSTCSAKTLQKTRHDRSASRSSTAAEQFYTKSTPDVADIAAIDSRYNNQDGLSTFSNTTKLAGTKKRNQSESDRARRDKYRDRLNDRSSVDNWLSDRNDCWLSDRESRLSDREGRFSDRESRLSDRDSRGSVLSDRDNCGVYSDRESQLSDCDGRVSEAGSEWSVYDVPPPPKSITGRSGGSKHTMSVHETTPRALQSSHHSSSRDKLSPGTSSQSKAPPKPPRRSMCPPSPPASTGDELEAEVVPSPGRSSHDSLLEPPTGGGSVVSNPAYEMICFASTGTAKRRTKHKKHETDQSRGAGGRQEGQHDVPRYRARHTTSDSDSDPDRPSDKPYTQMTFKPVKSKRTSKTTPHSYENHPGSASTISCRHSTRVPPSSPIPPSAPPSTPLQKIPTALQSQDAPTEPKQPRHHYSSPSLTTSALSVAPEAPTESSQSSAPATSRGDLPDSLTNVDAAASRKDESSGFSFSGYHINRISSVISKNTQQLFKSFSTIATSNTSSNGNTTARQFAKAFSISVGSDQQIKADQETLEDGRSDHQADTECHSEPALDDGKFEDLDNGGEFSSRPSELNLENSTSAASAPASVEYQPLSPSHYQQPPTPDHSPPSAEIAQSIIKQQILRSIQNRGSPERRRRGDADEACDEGVVLRRPPQREASSSGSPASLNTDNIIVERFNSERPFAGLVRGSIGSMEWADGSAQKAEGATDAHRHMAPTYSPPPSNRGTSRVGERLSNPLHSLHDEDWVEIDDELYRLDKELPRFSMMDDLKQELEQKLGLSLSSTKQGLGILEDVTKQTASAEATSTDADTVQPDPTSATANCGDVVLQCGSLEEWLNGRQLPQYVKVLRDNGFDSVQFMNGVLSEEDMAEMGIKEESHIAALKSGLDELPASLPPANTLYKVPKTVSEWLESIDLMQYEENFTKNGFGYMERVRKIWEVELSMVLEVSKLGHKKRILTSLGNRPIEPPLPATLDPKDLSIELSKLNEDIHELKEQLFADLPTGVSRECRPPESTTATIRRSGKKTRAPLPPNLMSTRAQPTVDLDNSLSSSDPPSVPVNPESLTLRDPSHLLQVSSSNVKPSQTTWKHEPRDFIDTHIEFVVTYLGSTRIREVRGPETTMQSIHQVRKTAEASERELAFEEGDKPAPPPHVVLAISSSGVRYSTPHDQELVCEHEIRNIHGVCQDADDLSHFAYITVDKSDGSHWCHVFRADTRDWATDIVLALGEAFEVAFQLREGKAGPSKPSSHSRTRSDCSHAAVQAGVPDSHSARSHSRSLSGVPRHAVCSSAHDLLPEEEEEEEKKEEPPPQPNPEPRRASEGCLLDAPSSSGLVRRDSEASSIKTKAPKPPPLVARRQPHSSNSSSSSSSSHHRASQPKPPRQNHHSHDT